MKFLKSIFVGVLFFGCIIKTSNFIEQVSLLKENLDTLTKKPKDSRQLLFINSTLSRLHYFLESEVKELIEKGKIKYHSNIFSTAQKHYRFLIHPDRTKSFENNHLINVWNSFKSSIEKDGKEIFDTKNIIDLVNSTNTYIRSLQEKNNSLEESKIVLLKNIFLRTPQGDELIEKFYQYFSLIEQYLDKAIEELFFNKKINTRIVKFNNDVNNSDFSSYKSLRNTEFVCNKMFDYLQTLEDQLEFFLSNENANENALDKLKILKKQFEDFTDIYIYFGNTKDKFTKNIKYPKEEEDFIYLKALINELNTFIDKNELLAKGSSVFKVEEGIINDKKAIWQEIQKIQGLSYLYRGFSRSEEKRENIMITKVKNSESILEFKKRVEDLKKLYKKALMPIFLISDASIPVNFIRMSYFINSKLEDYYSELFSEDLLENRKNVVEPLLDHLRVSLNGFFSDFFKDRYTMLSTFSTDSLLFVLNPFPDGGPMFWYEEAKKRILDQQLLNQSSECQNKKESSFNKEEVNLYLYDLLRIFCLNRNHFLEEHGDRDDYEGGYINNERMHKIRENIMTKERLSNFNMEGLKQIQNWISCHQNETKKLPKE